MTDQVPPDPWPFAHAIERRTHACRVLFERGIPVVWVGDERVYADDGIPVGRDQGGEDRPCPVCGEAVEWCAGSGDPYPPDPCLGWLEGVDYACCGQVCPTYQSGAGETIETQPILTRTGNKPLYGSDALVEMRRLGGNPP